MHGSLKTTAMAMLGLIVGAANIEAQKSKPAPPPPPMPKVHLANAVKPIKPEVVKPKPPKPEVLKPPVVKPDKPDKVEKPPKPDDAAKEAERAAREAAKADAKAENRLEKQVREEPKHLLKGIKLTHAQKRQIHEIDKQYEEQLKTIVKEDQAADKAHAPTSDLAAVTALRDQERAALRALLTPEQQAKFDANILHLSKKK